MFADVDTRSTETHTHTGRLYTVKLIIKNWYFRGNHYDFEKKDPTILVLSAVNRKKHYFDILSNIYSGITSRNLMSGKANTKKKEKSMLAKKLFESLKSK